MIFAVIIAGCNQSTGGSSLPKFGSSTSKRAPEINVYVGTQGLTAEFVKNAPPQKVFENSRFPILIKIRNIGAYNIRDYSGTISIGRETDYIPQLFLEPNNRVVYDVSKTYVIFNVEGKTQINPKGDEILASLNARTGKLDPQSENKPSTLTATLCYPYKTMLSTTVCIDPDVAGIRPGKKVCTVKELAFKTGQGSPIAVTKIEPQMIPEVGKEPSSEKDIIRPQFLIFIENKGRGNPVNIRNYKDACSRFDFAQLEKREDEIRNIWNVAFLRAYTSGKEGENQLICCPNIDGQCNEEERNPDKMTGFIRFHDKKDFVRCIFKEPKTDKDRVKRTDDAFTSPLRIEIDYGYVQTISTKFFIQKPLKY